VVTAVVVLGCASQPRNAASYTEVPVSIQSPRGVQIPALLAVPKGPEGIKYPVVVFAHGHGGSKTELVLVSHAIAEAGIATLTLDFSGRGDSKEDPVKANRVTYMVDDIKAAKEYLKTVPNIDINRLGILGYSMGGRVAALVTGADPDFKTVVFWSPAYNDGAVDVKTFMSLKTDADYTKLLTEARKNGSAGYHNYYDPTPDSISEVLGVGWYEDMANTKPSSVFINGFKGNALLITGEIDPIIPPASVEPTIKSAKGAKVAEIYQVKGSEHSYGMWGDTDKDKALRADTMSHTVAFFKKYL
jgi:dienelactone hydrolase